MHNNKPIFKDEHGKEIRKEEIQELHKCPGRDLIALIYWED